jgi:hypothetical protein
VRVPAKAQAQMMADKTGGSRDEYVHRCCSAVNRRCLSPPVREPDEGVRGKSFPRNRYSAAFSKIQNLLIPKSFIRPAKRTEKH